MDEGQNVRRVLQKDIQQHLRYACHNRAYECEYCGEKGSYLSIKVHENICEHKIIPCPIMECKEKIERIHVQEHVELYCPYTEVACKYANVGCDVRMKRKLIREHEQNDEFHLHKAMSAVVNLQKAVKILKERTDILPTGEFVTFKLTRYESNRRSNKAVMSPSFYTSPNGYKLSLKVYLNGHADARGSNMSAYIHILKGEYDRSLTWPLVGRITIELLNQLADKNHHKKTLKLMKQDNARAGDDMGWGYTKFFLLSRLPCDQLSAVQFLKDDCLYFRISVTVDEYKPWLEKNLLSQLSS